jgi:hypothetical protein
MSIGSKANKQAQRRRKQRTIRKLNEERRRLKHPKPQTLAKNIGKFQRERK